MRRILFITALVTTPAFSSSQPQETRTFLRSVLGFGESELRDLAQARAAVRSLETVDGREIAIAGAIRVPLTPQQYIAQLTDIVEFKRHEAVQQIGTFGSPPQVSDIAGLTLDGDHVADLRECRVFDCGLQLSRRDIDRFGAIGWSAPDAPEQANRVMRELLTELVANYGRVGDAALMTYENERPALSVAQQFRAMTAAPPAVLQHFSPLERHITGFTGSAAPGIDDVLYWSKEDVGPQVIISVTHMAIYKTSSAPVVYAVASKQLYGSHYFDSSLGLTLLLRDDEPSSTVLVYLNRSRIDALDGFLGGLKRAVVRSRGRAAMADTLSRIRARLPGRVRGGG